MEEKKILNEIPDSELEKVSGGMNLDLPTIDSSSRHQKKLDEIMDENLSKITSGKELVKRETTEERQISEKVKKLVSDIQGSNNVIIY